MEDATTDAPDRVVVLPDGRVLLDGRAAAEIFMVRESGVRRWHLHVRTPASDGSFSTREDAVAEALCRLAPRTA